MGEGAEAQARAVMAMSEGVMFFVIYVASIAFILEFSKTGDTYEAI